MLTSHRCGAKTRAGGSCKSPSISGKKRCRMHGGAAGSGAPKNNHNALKHGFYSREEVRKRRLIKLMLDDFRKTLSEIE
ncbi:HGGxSTG domain-containing protein [Qipengyuania nanhaisediminis]